MSFKAFHLERQDIEWSWPFAGVASGRGIRSRLMIKVDDDKLCSHEAELGPLPSVHPESLDDAAIQWRDVLLPLFNKTSLEIASFTWDQPYFGLLSCHQKVFTSVQTAAEQLLLSWVQSHDPECFMGKLPQALPGSALLALKPESEALNWREFEELYAEGFRFFKCKIGRGSARSEVDFLRRITEYAGPNLRLRLDANRQLASSDLAYWREAIGDFPIDYCEESSSVLDAALGRVALDESLWDRSLAELSQQPAAVWILKPSRLTLTQTVALLKQGQQLGIICVLSNAFDSGLSLRCFAWLYARFCAKPQAIGYGTVRFLPDDRWNSQNFGRAEILIPQLPFATELSS
jgi:O-succinylbenzoate synthase